MAHRPQVGLYPAGGPLLRGYSAQRELKLEVWDSPNSAGVIIDALRAAKVALDRKLGDRSCPHPATS